MVVIMKPVSLAIMLAKYSTNSSDAIVHTSNIQRMFLETVHISGKGLQEQ